MANVPVQLTNPSDAIGQLFSQFEASQTPAQPSPSPNEVNTMINPLLQQVQNQQPPPGRPVPAVASPMQAFLGALASNMGSSLTRNPMFAENFARQQEQERQQQEQAQHENYLQNLAFDQNKQKELMAIRGQALEANIAAAQKAGDLNAAAKNAQALEKLRTQIQGIQGVQEHQARMEEIKQQGKNELAAAQVRQPQEKEADKDIKAIMDQYGVGESTARVMKMSGGMRNVTKQTTSIDPLTKQPVTKTEMNPTPYATEQQANDLIDSDQDWARAMAKGVFPPQVPDDPGLRNRLRKRAVAASRQPSMAEAVRQ